jgi:hypothetical protein
LYNDIESVGKEVKVMPTLRHLLEELRKIDVDPDEVRIPGQLYDDLVDDAEDIAEENPTEEDN